MAPQGYVSCPGCGRLFNRLTELDLYEDHDCSEPEFPLGLREPKEEE